ncbi:neuromedin-K receptor-like [Scylla paramamosain]|uniref:neuromedin-K receptor-like n=1 Tax=Scylla paramamosain TaxID=85552 RepID=UPI0030839E34
MDDYMNFSCDKDPRTTTNFSQYEYDGRTTIWVPITWREVIKLIAYIITFLVSIVGNLLVILVVRYNRNMRSSTNQYLVNLAVADLLVTLVCKLVHLIRHLSYPHYVLPAIVCKLDGFVQGTALVASVFTLTVISIGRFVAIMFPLHARTSPDRAIWVIAAVWIAAALLSSPMLIYREFYSIKWSNFTTWHCNEFFPMEKKVINGLCVVTYDAKKLFYIIFTITCYFLPVTIMLVNYSLIVWKLWGAQQPGEHHQQQVATTRNTQRVVRMVTVVLLVFVVCWTPLQTLILYTTVREEYEFVNDIEFTAYFVAQSNSALNPIIYCGFNANFRQGLVALLYCRHSRGSHTYYPQSWRGITGTRDTTSGYSGPEPAVLVEMGSVRHSRLTQRRSSSSVGGRVVYTGPGRELCHDHHHYHHHHLCDGLNDVAKTQQNTGGSGGISTSNNSGGSSDGGGGGDLQEVTLAQRTFVRASYRQNGRLNNHNNHTTASSSFDSGKGGREGRGDTEETCGCCCGRKSGGKYRWRRKDFGRRWIGGGIGGWRRRRGRWEVGRGERGGERREVNRWGRKGEQSGRSGLKPDHPLYKEIYTLNTGLPDAIFVKGFEAVV